MDESLAGKRPSSPAARGASARRSRAGCTRRARTCVLHYRDSESRSREARRRAQRGAREKRVRGSRRSCSRRSRRARSCRRRRRASAASICCEQRFELLPGRRRRDRGFALGGAHRLQPARAALHLRRRRPRTSRKRAARSSTSSTSTPSGRSRATRSTASPRRGSRRSRARSRSSSRRAVRVNGVAPGRHRLARGRPARAGPSAAASSSTTPLARIGDAGGHRAGGTLPRRCALCHRAVLAVDGGRSIYI